MRVAIFGGTFNPVHKGHIFLAVQAKRILKLDKVIFVPARIPPHKVPAGIINPAKRFHMIRLAVSGKKGFNVSRYELDKKGKAYSIDTVRYFRKILPKRTRLYFLTGADVINGLDAWKESEKLFTLCDFVIFSRPGFRLGPKESGFKTLDINALDVSSTMIRGLILENRPINGLVPGPVEAYIAREGLYRQGLNL